MAENEIKKPKKLELTKDEITVLSNLLHHIKTDMEKMLIQDLKLVTKLN